MTVINSNISASIASNSLMRNEKAMTTSMERLSTGLRINSAKDDAAGLAIASRMTSQVKGLNQAIRNANDGVSLMQTAGGAMTEVSNMLQRMRELAVQSSTSTNTDADRDTLNAEVQELVAEIDSIAINTSFNNKSLLDGTFGNQNLQIGYQAGQTLSVSMSNLRTNSIGAGVSTALSASGDFAATKATLETDRDLNSGDLVINGVAVGATADVDDSLSVDAKSASAIAVVAAINRVSDSTGVQATVGTTILEGTAMTAAALTGTVTINGVATASITTTADAGASRALVTAAVNLLSSQTGVRAVDTGSDKGGIQFIADDGRNITVSVSTLTEIATGATAGVQSGSYSLQSMTGDNITISSTAVASTTLAKSGLSAGTSDSSKATLTSVTRATGDAAPAAGTTGLLELGDMSINGSNIAGAIATDDTASDTTATSSTKTASAIATAAAINKSSETTGVTATANANVIVGTAFTAAANADMFVNGVDVGESLATDTRATLAVKINAFSGQTGVVATDNGTGLTYTAADGRNISLATTDGVAAGMGVLVANLATTATTAALASTTYGSITLSSDSGFTVDRATNAKASLNALGFSAGSYGAGTSGGQIANVSLATEAGSISAISTIDAAITTVSEAQGKLGAVENRLDYTINNLSSMVTNASASRSRIQDADYAKETTELARTQIIAQAGTAMLAQANQVKQTVLSLLK
jgi:flagellin